MAGERNWKPLTPHSKPTVITLTSGSMPSAQGEEARRRQKRIWSIIFSYGWMSRRDAGRFLKEVEQDDRIHVIVEDATESIKAMPPTKLRNPKLFAPFELFVEMYGLPAYHEMDPTVFIALTYTFMFGAMFGDVGQGACSQMSGGIAPMS